ncbi:MAG TPA: hypothetical protein VFY92_02445 [Hyphomicrobiaceae bacterium]|nr:hypothetical protein [Hyphomicrobiaceae bacterium]
MDITLVSHLGSVGPTADAGRASVARGAQPVAKPLAVEPARMLVERAVAVSAVEIAEAVQAIEAAELPTTYLVRSELNVDDASKRFVSRTVDRETGATVDQYPAEALLRLFAKTREQFDQLYKEDA